MEDTITKQELYDIVRKDENSEIWVEQPDKNEDGVIYSGLMVKQLKVGDLEITLQEYFDFREGFGPWACDANINPVLVGKNRQNVQIVDSDGDQSCCTFSDLNFSFNYEELFGLFGAKISSRLLEFSNGENGCIRFVDEESLVEDYDFSSDVIQKIAEWKKENNVASILNLGEDLYQARCEITGRVGRSQWVLCTDGKHPPLEFE